MPALAGSISCKSSLALRIASGQLSPRIELPLTSKVVDPCAKSGEIALRARRSNISARTPSFLPKSTHHFAPLSAPTKPCRCLRRSSKRHQLQLQRLVVAWLSFAAHRNPPITSTFFSRHCKANILPAAKPSGNTQRCLLRYRVTGFRLICPRCDSDPLELIGAPRWVPIRACARRGAGETTSNSSWTA